MRRLRRLRGGQLAKAAGLYAVGMVIWSQAVSMGHNPGAAAVGVVGALFLMRAVETVVPRRRRRC